MIDIKTQMFRLRFPSAFSSDCECLQKQKAFTYSDLKSHRQSTWIFLWCNMGDLRSTIVIMPKWKHGLNFLRILVLLDGSTAEAETYTHLILVSFLSPSGGNSIDIQEPTNLDSSHFSTRAFFKINKTLSSSLSCRALLEDMVPRTWLVNEYQFIGTDRMFSGLVT